MKCTPVESLQPNDKVAPITPTLANMLCTQEGTFPGEGCWKSLFPTECRGAYEMRKNCTKNRHIFLTTHRTPRTFFIQSAHCNKTQQNTSPALAPNQRCLPGVKYDAVQTRPNAPSKVWLQKKLPTKLDPCGSVHIAHDREDSDQRR